MKLTKEEVVSAGKWAVFVTIGEGGTAKMQMSVDSKYPQDITGASWTENATATIELPACAITPVLTGVAEISISKINA